MEWTFLKSFFSLTLLFFTFYGMAHKKYKSCIKWEHKSDG